MTLTNDNINMIRKEQEDLLKELNIKGLPINLEKEKIIYALGYLESKDLFMHRSTPAEDDSGWYIGPIDADIEEKAENYEALFGIDLFSLRPELMKILALPVGYIALFKDGELSSIADENDEEVWRKN